MNKELLEKYPIFNEAQEITHLNKHLIRVEKDSNKKYDKVRRNI